MMKTSNVHYSFRSFVVIFLIITFFHWNVIVVVEGSEAAGTETLVGIVGKDFVLLMADSSVSQGYALQASNLDKIAPISHPFPQGTTTTTGRRNNRNKQQSQHQQMAILAAAAGDAADSDRLLGYLKAYATLEEYQNGWGSDVRVISGSSLSSSSSSQEEEQQYDAGRSSIIIEEARPGLDVEALANYARLMIFESLRTASPYRVCLLIGGMIKVKQQQNQLDNILSSTNNLQGDTTSKISSFASEMVQRQVEQVLATTRGDSKSSLASSSLTVPSTSSLSSTSASYQPRLFWLDEYGSVQQIQYGAHGLGSNFILSVLDRGYRPDMTLDEATSLMKECFLQLRSRYLINSPQPPCIKCINVDGIQYIPVVDL